MFLRLNNKFVNLDQVAYINLEQYDHFNQVGIGVVFSKGGSIKMVREDSTVDEMAEELQAALNEGEEAGCIAPWD